MVDELDTMALNLEGGEETTPDVTPTPEIETSEESTQEVPETQPEAPEETEEGKKGAQNRIRELANKAKAESERADSLAKKLAELTQGTDTQQPLPQYDNSPLPPIVAPGEELSAEELNARIAQRDQLLLQKSMQFAQFYAAQNKVLDNINREARASVKKYPQLNPESSEYNPKLSKAVTEATEAYVKANPTKSVKQFVDNMMEPYQQSVEREVGNQQKAIVSQAAQTGIRPTTIKQPDKSAQDKSIAELEAELGIVQG